MRMDAWERTGESKLLVVKRPGLRGLQNDPCIRNCEQIKKQLPLCDIAAQPTVGSRTQEPPNLRPLDGATSWSWIFIIKIKFTGEVDRLQYCAPWRLVVSATNVQQDRQT